MQYQRLSVLNMLKLKKEAYFKLKKKQAMPQLQLFNIKNLKKRW